MQLKKVSCVLRVSAALLTDQRFALFAAKVHVVGVAGTA